jgi:integrase
MLRDAAEQEKYTTIVDIIRQVALTGCRRSEMIGPKLTEVDTEASCLRFEDSKEGDTSRSAGPSPRSGISRDVDDRFGRDWMRFLRQIVPDAAP